MPSIIKIVPRYAETDQMGVIHHSIYAQYYEMGRVELCNEIGLPFLEIENRGLRLALTKMESEFKKPMYFGEVYELTTTLSNMSKLKLILTYEIKNHKNELIHQATTTLVWLNQQFKPINLEKTDRLVYQRFLDRLEV